MDKEYHKSHAFESKHMVDSNRKMTRIANDYKGDANPQRTRHMLKDSDNALEELVDLMARNGITDASKISVVKKDKNAQWVNERYDSASYEVYKGWKIVLKIGNDTWEWGVR